MPGFAQRLAGIPWRSIARQGLSRVFLVAKAYCVIHVVNDHLCSVTLVRGASMLPSLNLAGDAVAVDSVSVRLGRVAPGDIVLMISPEDPRKSVVKRVIGMQGDSVTYLVDPGKSDSSSRTVVVSWSLTGLGWAFGFLLLVRCCLRDRICAQLIDAE